jgi:acid stress-induced BolA-like protein IbaG/YrbA
MNLFEEKTKRILIEHFNPTVLIFEPHDEFRFHVFIASDKFEAQGDFDRQTRIWKVLKKNLTKAEQKKIVRFSAYTPGEYEAYSAPLETSA